MAVVPHGAYVEGMEMPDLDKLAGNAAEGWSLGRVIIVGGNPWFKGRDVATSLGYKNPTKALREHVTSKHKAAFQDLLQKGSLNNQGPLGQYQGPLSNQQPHELYINEPGLYSLIFRSKLPKAEAFTDWVTEEVLPAIRVKGLYSTTTFSARCSAILSGEDSRIEGRREENGLDLYVMRYSHDCSAVKIGRANDPRTRKRQLEQCHNFQLDLLAIFPEAGHLERQVHEKLQGHRSRKGAGTEWFAVSESTALRVIRDMLPLRASQQPHELYVSKLPMADAFPDGVTEQALKQSETPADHRPPA